MSSIRKDAGKKDYNFKSENIVNSFEISIIVVIYKMYKSGNKSMNNPHCITLTIQSGKKLVQFGEYNIEVESFWENSQWIFVL